MIVTIKSVSRKRPKRYVVCLFLSGDVCGGVGSVLVNLKALELLVKFLGAKNIRDLKDKTFPADTMALEEALLNFFKEKCPLEEGIEVSLYTKKAPKYDPPIWTIAKVENNVRYSFFGHEDPCWGLLVEEKKKGYLVRSISFVCLRKETFNLLLQHFGIKKPEDLVGKEFRANFDDAHAALLSVALQRDYPTLV